MVLCAITYPVLFPHYYPPQNNHCRPPYKLWEVGECFPFQSSWSLSLKCFPTQCQEIRCRHLPQPGISFPSHPPGCALGQHNDSGYKVCNKLLVTGHCSAVTGYLGPVKGYPCLFLWKIPELFTSIMGPHPRLEKPSEISYLNLLLLLLMKSHPFFPPPLPSVSPLVRNIYKEFKSSYANLWVEDVPALPWPHPF